MAPRLPVLLLSIFFLAVSLTWPAEPSPPPPRTVSLHLNQVPLGKALAELTNQSGIQVKDERGDSDLKLSLELQDVPFWKALEEIARASHAQVVIGPRESKIALVKRSKEDSTRITHSGPFRIALKRISVSRDLENGNHQASGLVEVAWEPALQPFYLETRPHDLVVKDNQGKAIPGSAQGSSMAPVDGRIALLFDVPLPAPPRSVPSIGVVEGHFRAIVPTRMLSFHFASLDQIEKAPPDAAVRSQSEERINCRVSKVTLDKERWTIQLVLDTPPGASKLDTYQSWLVNNELVLVSKDGTRRLSSSSDVVESVSDRRAIISYNFTDRDGRLRGQPGEWTVRYTAPAGVAIVPIPFRFSDISLP